MEFTWIKKQHVSFTNSLETLYKDQATGAKKWVIILRTESILESTAKPRIEYYGPKDQGPYASETELKHNLKRMLKMEKVILTTRQNKKGGWTCSSEINSIEKPTPGEAQRAMIDYYISQGVCNENIKLKPLIHYTSIPVENEVDLQLSIGKVFLDHNPIG